MYPNGGVREAAPMNKLKTPKEYLVDHNKEVQKLPNGINLVTMMRPELSQPIQVKLPLTGIYRGWGKKK